MSKSGESIDRLLGVIKKLRAPDGCPWDQEQTHDSLKSDLIEEAYTRGGKDNITAVVALTKH